MSRYLLTGASGFIGRRLSEYLSSQGHEVLREKALASFLVRLPLFR